MNKYETIALKVSEEFHEKRLDVFLKYRLPELSRTKIQDLINDKLVWLPNSAKPIKKSTVIQDGEEYQIKLINKKKLVSQNPILDVVYEDEYLAVINKPTGLPVHRGIGTNITLADLLLKHYGIDNLSNLDSDRPGIVHRLDKETSGLIIIAKNDYMHHKLSSMIEKKEIIREYIAFVHGIPQDMCGIVNTKIKPTRDKRAMMISPHVGKESMTGYQVIGSYNENFSIVECKLYTGRTHQIRLHMAHLGCPVINDKLYNKIYNNAEINRQGLHAHRITIPHPILNTQLIIRIDIPDDMLELLKFIIT
ncbi:MAG: RluA family pseudouridine synthase [Anaplasmataceae bacterium]|nr:RluA family pseudouridine synthase [Anaplasmataceae bacterium]